MLPGSTGVSQGFAVAVAVLSVGGSVQTQSVLPAVYGLLYTACFALAMQGLSTPLHLVLLIAMIGLSFALHLVFLPAGSTAHTAPAQRARLSSHTHTHTHAHAHTRRSSTLYYELGPSALGNWGSWSSQQYNWVSATTYTMLRVQGRIR